MKTLGFTILFWVLFLVTGAHTVYAESISKFSADYTVNPDASVTVVETINYDFADAERHGIYRAIKNKHPQPASVWYKKRFIELEGVTVKRDGEDEPFLVTKTAGTTEIKIGKEKELLQGEHTYTITYTLMGALSYGSRGTEFYYNVTGSDWTVPIMLATATVHSDALASRFYCYQGVVGQTSTCTNSMKYDGVVTFTASNLDPESELTVATELDANKIATVMHEEVTWLLFGYVLAAIWIIGVIFLVLRFRRSAYRTLPVIAQYEPYKNCLPMYTGVLVDNQLDPRDTTAGILYLAQQGFIKITQTAQKVFYIITVHDYDIAVLRPLPEITSKFLRSLIELLFTIEAPVGTKVALSSLFKNQGKNLLIIQSLQVKLQNDLLENGFFTKEIPQLKKIITLTILLFIGIFGFLLFVPQGVILIAVIFGATVVCSLTLLISRRTTLGYEAKNHLDGFKLFLSVTDKERFDFHNAPEKSPELFMQYLPYAVALGVEEKWAKVFEGITIPQPDWYSGGTIAAFSAGSLTHDLGAFSTALSANSGVSGSSGGGSSGGGGGGGGGGSW